MPLVARSVKIRSPDFRSVTPEIRVAHVIDHDDQNIRPGIIRVRWQCITRREAREYSDRWARHDYSREVQYLGLGLYIVAEAAIFLPLIYIAQAYAPGVIQNAALITLALVGGLTFTAFSTRKNFSFLAPALSIGGFVALGVIIASIAFGFQLGLLFSGVMIVFAGGSILYTTSNMIHEYRTDQHVAASLGLFASVGLMFWYVLQFLMSMAGGE